MRRIIQGIILLALLIVLGASYWLFATNAGLRWSLLQLNGKLDYPILYNNVHGSFNEEITWDQLTIQSSEFQIALTNPRLELGFAELVSGTLNIVSLSAKQIDLQSRPSVSDTKKSADESLSLPLFIDLQRVSIDSLTVRQGDEEPLQFNKILLTDARVKRQIEFGSLSFSTPYGTLNATGELPLQLEGELELRAELQVANSESLPALNGIVNLKGPLNNILIDAGPVEPLAMNLKGSLNAVAQQPSWSLLFNAQKLPLHKFIANDETELTGLEIRSAGTIEDFTLIASTHLQHPQAGPWNGELDARQSNSTWTINHLRFTDPERQRQLVAQATIHSFLEFAPTTQADLKLGWENLVWPIDSEAGSRSKSGSLMLSGNLQDYQVQLETELAFGTQRINALKAHGKGDIERLALDSVTCSYIDGNWQGAGSLSFTDGLQWQMDAAVSNLDVAAFDPRWPSKLSSAVKHQGKFTQGKVVTTTHFANISGKVSGLQVRGSGSLDYTDDYWQLKDVKLTSGKSYVKADFKQQFATDTTMEIFDVRWDANIIDVAPFYATASGNLRSNGRFEMQADKYRVQAKANTSRISFGNIILGNTNLQTDIDLFTNKQIEFSLRAKNAEIADQPIKLKNATINILGSLDKHNLNVVLHTEQEDHLTLAAVGSLVNDHWQTKITSTDLTSEDFGHWAQQQTASLDMTTETIKLNNYCLIQDQHMALVCADWNSRNNDMWQLSTTYKKLPLEMLQAWLLLPPQFSSISAALDGQAVFEQLTGDDFLRGSITAKSDTGVLRRVEVDKKLKSVEFANFQFQVTNRNTPLQMTTSVEFVDIGYVNFLISFPQWNNLAIPGPEQVISGKVDVDLNTLAFISLLTDDIHNAVGHWKSHLRLSGKLESPTILGTSNITASQMSLPQIGLTLTDLNLKAESHNDRSLQITGSARSGNGDVKIRGRLGDYRTTSLVGNLKLDGKSFEVIRVPEALVIISPSLNLELQKDQIHAEGDIHIDEALFQIYMPSASITPSTDVVIVNEPDSTDQAQQKNIISANVRIILGDKVNLQGYGFAGRLTGSLAITEKPGQSTASGELAILDGKYNAYGRSLDISEGKLSFTGGAIQNPIVRIKAKMNPNPNLEVGIMVDGEAKEPKVQLYSEPPLEDVDILSYIILGYPVKDAKGGDGDMLATAAASLGLMGGEKLVKYIANKFGIDEVKLESDHTTQAARVVLGKYLSPELYIRYAYGIGETANTLQLQYQLTNQWVLKTESDDAQTSTEILFTIERD